jgi:hypothetical protein
MLDELFIHETVVSVDISNLFGGVISKFPVRLEPETIYDWLHVADDPFCKKFVSEVGDTETVGVVAVVPI